MNEKRIFPYSLTLVVRIDVVLSFPLFSTTSSASTCLAKRWQRMSVAFQSAYVFCFLKGVVLWIPYILLDFEDVLSRRSFKHDCLYLDVLSIGICLSFGLSYTDKQDLSLVLLKGEILSSTPWLTNIVTGNHQKLWNKKGNTLRKIRF